ncbi:MAG: PEGA domain-containing protein [Candidatus Marinimicrobia bacterium]|nr:PEGA domain-containing protein [Candidatus Neomarinimicrobiota bacterium]
MLKSKILVTIMIFFMTISAQQADTTVSVTEEVVEKEQKIPIAVMDLDANNIDESEAKALSDRMRVEIVQIGVFDVMERKRMADILNEMKFQLSGTTTDANAIEIGKMVGVRKIVAGSVGKIDNIYTISVRLIDIETGRIERTAVYDIYGTLSTVFKIGIPTVASDLCSVKKMKPKSILYLDSRPSQADVYVDGIYEGMTPIFLEIEPQVAHRLVLKKESYADREKMIFLNKNQIVEMILNLEKIPVPAVVKPELIKEEKNKVKRSYNNGFKVSYSFSRDVTVINDFISSINYKINNGVNLFKTKIENYQFPEITSFNGIEFWNTDRSDEVTIDFGIAIYKSNLEEWFGNLVGGESESEQYRMEIWNPRLTFNLCITPVKYFLFYPFFNIGFGYNVLFLNVYHEIFSIGGPTYHTWGFNYGAGFEIRPIKPIGMSIEWNRRNMNLKLMDINKITKKFDENGLDRFDISGENISFSITFYY